MEKTDKTKRLKSSLKNAKAKLKRRDDVHSDSGYCLVVYNGEEYIIHALDNYFNPYALGILINEDPGVLEISSYSVESSICIEDSDIEVFNDWKLNAGDKNLDLREGDAIL